MNPLPEERKTLLEFCHVLVGAGTQALVDWLEERGFAQERYGLAEVPNAKGVYAMNVDPTGALGYGGVISGAAADSVRLSSIPKGEPLTGYLHVLVDGYSQHCRAHREYWDWVDKRNDARYTANVEQDCGYDAKSMMHVFRLLDMAVEILRDEEINILRPNREELLEIRSGAFAYEGLLARAEGKMREVEAVAKTSVLPEVPDAREIERALVDVQEEIFGGD